MFDVFDTWDENFAYGEGREDVIEEILVAVREQRRGAYQYLNSDFASGFLSALSAVEEIAEQIREKKND